MNMAIVRQASMFALGNHDALLHYRANTTLTALAIHQSNLVKYCGHTK